MRSVIVVLSCHHGNTARVAARMAAALGARLAGPEDIDPAELADYDLVGFGSGIYSARHHEALLRLADRLPRADGGRAFLFSTDGTPRSLMKNEAALESKAHNDHAALRERLLARGYEIVGEFGCAGFNTNGFLRLFGGINRGRPDAEDLARATAFTREMATATIRD